MKNAARKGNSKAVEFDKKVQALGWELLAKEHRFSWGGMCNVAGFDRLYATRAGPVLCEITTDDRRADHRKAIEVRLDARPLLGHFAVLLVVYHGGQKRLAKNRKEKTWTQAGTWSWEWLIRPAAGVCRICGCTHEEPCEEPVCGWADELQTICTNCAEKEI